MRIGPYYRQKPSAVTTIETWAWCWLWLDKQGRVFLIEWCSWDG